MASRGNGNGPAQPLGRGTGRQSPPRRAVSEDIRVRPGRSGSLSTETTTGGHRGGLERSRTGSTGGVGKIFTGMAAVSATRPALAKFGSQRVICAMMPNRGNKTLSILVLSDVASPSPGLISCNVQIAL